MFLSGAMVFKAILVSKPLLIRGFLLGPILIADPCYSELGPLGRSLVGGLHSPLFVCQRRTDNLLVSNRTEALEQIIAPAVTAVGMDLWGVEFISQGRHSVLRVYIDSDHGVNLEDCERVSHQVSGVLDVEDPIKSEYNLEVSSPGLDRPLFRFEQYAAFCGEQLKVRLRSAVDGRRNFSGLLKMADNAMLEFEVDGETMSVPYDRVEKANLIPRFD